MAHQVAFHILNTYIGLEELNYEDFAEWFEKKARGGKEGGKIQFIGWQPSQPGQQRRVSPFAKLLAMCARRAVHLSVPIQTFAPVSL